MCITCPILGRFCALGSVQRKATRRARFSALEVGFSGSLGSRTPSGFLLLTIFLSQSTKFTWKFRVFRYKQMKKKWNDREGYSTEMYQTNLFWRPTIINRVPSCKNFHNKNSKTINITSFIQHASTCIFRSNISANRRISKIAGNNSSWTIHRGRNGATEKEEYTNPKVPMTRVVI